MISRHENLLIGTLSPKRGYLCTATASILRFFIGARDWLDREAAAAEAAACACIRFPSGEERNLGEETSTAAVESVERLPKRVVVAIEAEEFFVRHREDSSMSVLISASVKASF